MREAIGATWITGIVITFIALFSGYLAFSVNYSKAFKIKDGIIDRIEKYNGFNRYSKMDIDNYMKEIGYYSSGGCKLAEAGGFITQTDLYAGVNMDVEPVKRPTTGEYNYCIQRIKSYNSSGQLGASYYQVIVFFSLSVPILKTSNLFNIKGETVNIYFPDDDYLT